MGSFRVEIRNRLWRCEVVADARASGLGKGSFGEVMWFIFSYGRGLRLRSGEGESLLRR